MSTPSRQMEKGVTITKGVRVKHFRTGQVYEIVDVKALTGNHWSHRILVTYKNVVTGEEYERVLGEFWEEVEVEPGRWVPRFTAVEDKSLWEEVAGVNDEKKMNSQKLTDNKRINTSDRPLEMDGKIYRPGDVIPYQGRPPGPPPMASDFVKPKHLHDLERMRELAAGLTNKLRTYPFRMGEDGLELPQEVCDWTSELLSIALRYLPVEGYDDDHP